jgi:hypothetical protein
MRQTSAQATGRKGERWFQNILPKEWIFQKPTEDFGLDGTVLIANSSHLSGLEFGVQVKASRQWVANRGFFVVSGVKYHTLLRWASPFMPTLLVLYDELLGSGYHAWIKDITPNIKELVLSRPRSITLKIPATSSLDENSWPLIRTWLENHNEGMLEAIQEKNLATLLLPAVHELTHALQLLLMAQSAHGGIGQDAEKMKGVGEITAHMAVIASLSRLSSNRYMKSPIGPASLAKYLDHFIDDYRRLVETFVPDFATCISKVDTPFVAWINSEVMARTRPRLVFMISECIASLSSLHRDKRHC